MSDRAQRDRRDSNMRAPAPSENFHRIKRTALLLSCGVILTFVPGIKLSEGNSTFGVSFHEVNITLVRSLLYISALYYFAGFILEFLEYNQAVSVQAVRREVWDANNVVDNLAARLRQKVDQYEEQSPFEEARLASDKLLAIADHWKSVAPKATANALRNAARGIVDDTARIFTGSWVGISNQEQVDIRAEGIRQEVRSLLNNAAVQVGAVLAPEIDLIKQGISDGFEGVRREVEEHRASLNEAAIVTRELALEIKKERQEMSRIHASFNRVMLGKLFGWELAGVAVPFLYASLLWCIDFARYLFGHPH